MLMTDQTLPEVVIWEAQIVAYGGRKRFVLSEMGTRIIMAN